MRRMRIIGPLLISMLIMSVFEFQRSYAGDLTDTAREALLPASGPSSTSTGPGGSNKASLEASGDKTAASSQLSTDWPIFSNAGYLQAVIMAEAPVTDTKNTNMDLGSVSALTAGVNTKLTVWGGKLPPFPTDPETNFDSDHCNAFLTAALGTQGFSLYSNTPGSVTHSMSCHDLARNASTALPPLVSAINDYWAKQDNCAGVKGNKCPPIQLQSDWRQAAQQAKFTMAKPLGSFNLFGLSVAGNQHNYSYVTTQAPSTVVKKNTEGYGIGLSFMQMRSDLPLSWIVGYSYEKPYKGGMGDTVCKPIGTSTSTTCSSATVGAPTRGTANIISAEARAIVFKQLAIGPRVEYDASGHNVGIKLPLYLGASTATSFTGGVEVGWTRDGHYQGALVLQQAFSFY